MIKPLIKSDNYMLHHRVDVCGYHLDRQELSKTLVENMLHYEGVGLSANQIGIWERAFAMIRDIEHNEIIVCFNPKIVKTYSESGWCEEGCLSFPDQTINVFRPNKIACETNVVCLYKQRLHLNKSTFGSKFFEISMLNFL